MKKTLQHLGMFILISFLSACGGASGSEAASDTPKDKQALIQKEQDIIKNSSPVKINRAEIQSKVNLIKVENDSFGNVENLSLERGLVEIVYKDEIYKHDQLLLVDNNGNALNKTYQYIGKVDTSKIGEYTQEYYIDRDGVKSGFTKHIFVVENTPPKIELIGAKQIEVELAKSLTIPFAKAYDREEFATINSKIIVTGSVDLYHEGRYELKYSVTDEKGLSDSVTRVVVVKAKDDMKIEGVLSDQHRYNLLDYMILEKEHDVKTFSNKSYITTNSYKKIINGYEVNGVKFLLATPDNEQ